MGMPASGSSCLGCAPPKRAPRPPAAMMAETCTNSDSTYEPLTANLPRRLAAAGELLHALGGDVEDALQPRGIDVAWGEYDKQPARGPGGDHRARRIRGRIAERTGAIDERNAAADVHVVLAD